MSEMCDSGRECRGWRDRAIDAEDIVKQLQDEREAVIEACLVKEREACAKIADNWPCTPECDLTGDTPYHVGHCPKRIADMIRTRRDQ